MRTTILLFSVLLMAFLASCEKIDPDEINDKGYTDGVFISNEGGFGNSNGSVSYFNRDSMVLHNNLFYKVNGRPLGDVVQSISIHGDRAYMVVNNSQKVEVVDLETFSSVGVVEGLSYPRYFLGINDTKGYVSNGSYNGFVYVIDLVDLTITDSVSVGFGPEEMLLYDGIVYVANSGGWGSDNTISIIDSESDELIENIVVGDNPKALAMDENDDLWVMCKGKVVYGADWSISEETKSELLKIDIGALEVKTRFEIGQTGDFYWPTGICCDTGGENILYSEAGGLYQIGIEAIAQTTAPLISKSFYGFGVDPETETIYGLMSGDFSSAGFLHRYYPDGTVMDAMAVGIAPNWLVFN